VFFSLQPPTAVNCAALITTREGLLFRSWIGFALAGLSIALSRSWHALSRFGIEFGSAGIGLMPGLDSPNQAERSNYPQQWTADEFAFERAIESYESLIDEMVRQRK
jgi:hypothetical protein